MKAQNPLSLDDWLLVARVAQEASLVQAAQSLGYSHATAFRRLGALEQRLGVRLFERRAGHYAATTAGEALAEAGSTMQAQADAVLLRVQGQDLRPRGVVRIASTEGVISVLLMPLLGELRQALPEVHLECVARNEFHNLSRREADLALRATPDPPPHLIGQRIAPMRQAVYAQRAKAERYQNAPLHQQPWIALDDSATGSQALLWLSRLVPLDQVALRFSGLLLVRAACLQGLGLAVLPCFLGDAEPGLIRLGEPLSACDSELWLLSHPDLRETVRVKAVRQWLHKALAAQGALLCGEKPRVP